jgi:hypothetical protein
MVFIEAGNADDAELKKEKKKRGKIHQKQHDFTYLY